MMPSDVIRPVPEVDRDLLGWTRWGCYAAWLSGALTFALVWAQHHWQVLHPHYLPFVILITIMAVATTIAFDSGLWYVIRDHRRWSALAWMVLGLIPLALFGFVGLYAMVEWEDRRVPNNLPMNLAKVMGVALMRLEASIEYPNRLESQRLVMFYDRLRTPREDAEAMDHHLAAMESMLGGSLRAKVYWIRGPLPKLGLDGLSTNGIALGSNTSPPDWRSYVGLDRHELAHASINQFRYPRADPPCVLEEGWAQSRGGESPDALSRTALTLHSENAKISLHQLLGPFWYHRDREPVYSFGGAFVDFLIRKHGMKKFLRLYNECRPESFEAVIRDVFSTDIDTLETEFWNDAMQQVRKSNQGKKD
jgi:hypothetical protein